MKSIMLRNIPEHWQIVRLGQLLVERKEKVSDKDYPSLSVTKSGIVPQLEHVAKTNDGDNRKRVRIGDLVINSRSDRKGSSGLSDHDGSVSLINIVLKPRYGYPRFMHHLLRSEAFQEEFFRFGHGIVADLWTTRYSELRGIKVALPDLATQKRIADFIECETNRIDQLIEKKQRLMELLEEKHSATITAAVSKGLDPNVPMKDSGIRWMGEIPVHWKVIRFGLVTKSIQTGPFGSQLHSNEYVEDETPVINPSNIKHGRLHPDLSCTVGAETADRLSRHKLDAGDIIVGRRGEMGRCAVVSANEVGWLCGTGCLKVQLNGRAFPEFISILLRTPGTRELLQLECVGSTMDNLNEAILSRIPMPIPPLEEQASILTYLAHKNEHIGTIQDKVNRSCYILKEFRSALITAAVTGQIDVEHWSRWNVIDRRLVAIGEDMGA